MSHELRILIADDDPDMRVYLAQCLRGAFSSSPHVIEASDGQVALEQIERERLDIVLTDVRMPRLSGLALCRHLDAHPDLQVPVLLVTGETELLPEVQDYADSQTNWAVLNKPFNMQILREAVVSLLGHDFEQDRQDQANGH